LYTGKKGHQEQTSFSESKDEENKIDMLDIKPEKIIPVYGDVMLKFKNNGIY
jgi:hypothetical protein